MYKISDNFVLITGSLFCILVKAVLTKAFAPVSSLGFVGATGVFF